MLVALLLACACDAPGVSGEADGARDGGAGAGGGGAGGSAGDGARDGGAGAGGGGVGGGAGDGARDGGAGADGGGGDDGGSLHDAAGSTGGQGGSGGYGGVPSFDGGSTEDGDAGATDGGEQGPEPRPVQFYFDPSAGGLLSCDGELQGTAIPVSCTLADALTIGREGWSGKQAVLHADGTITGACSGSLIAGAADQYNLTPDCVAGSNGGGGDPDPNAGVEPATAQVLVDEWFTDLPWHQKLSTVHSNLIDIPFVLPFEALSFEGLPAAQLACGAATTPMDRARCMLRYGIVNVVGMHRTDTLYAPGEAPDGQDCDDGECVEVKLRIQRLHTLTDAEAGYAADVIRNNPVSPGPPSVGFAVTEATIFAPWRPWYMGHFCGVDNARVDNAVCYDDYFTTGLQAPARTPGEWLTSMPGLFVPRGEPGTIYERFCQAGTDVCTLHLGKVAFDEAATGPQVPELSCEPAPASAEGGSFDSCEDEVEHKTQELDRQFNDALTHYADVGRYPWNEEAKQALGAAIEFNAFIGYYDLTRDQLGAQEATPQSTRFVAPPYVLPKRCTKENFTGARHGAAADIAALKRCSLNFEIHTSGFHEIWKHLFDGDVANAEAVAEIDRAIPGSSANQYGRTMFMYAGVGEQKLPVSFQVPAEGNGMSIHDQMYGSSIYTQYLPLVNPADQTLVERSYTDDFWHAFFMSNHMNQTPDHFIRGVRGRTLWHNEHRSKLMYQSVEVDDPPRDVGTRFEGLLDHVDFPAGFQVGSHSAPFHGNTCDSCHVRNGSGVPLMPNGQLPELHQARGMLADYRLGARDYTYTNVMVEPNAGPETAVRLPAMKMVLFDLGAATAPLDRCVQLGETDPVPAGGPGAAYSNPIMNFYGDSFGVNLQDDPDESDPRLRLPRYAMTYVDIGADDGFEVVDGTSREPYRATRVAISAVRTDNRCVDAAIAPRPAEVDVAAWPADCEQVEGQAVEQAIADGALGFMHLLGRRLGNTPLIEMIPDAVIFEAQNAQADPLGGIGFPGCFGLAPGTRVGTAGAMNYRSCASGVLGAGADDCYVSRWGWIGDRASLEDQVANAASVEMNITSREGYALVHPGAPGAQWVRYNDTRCGPADAACSQSVENSDITEQEIRDMATYQRWIGIPQRSEYQVASERVQRGEAVFRALRCNGCHVIDKVGFEADDNMLPDEERAHLQRLQAADYPFVSYLGTDLLQHDMGYLSQLARAPLGESLRNADGTVKAQFRAYVQPIRTPALKGLRFNRFVTDANHNTVSPISRQLDQSDPGAIVAGCDFLLHDGRACDAIEAAWLHDGPAVRALGMIGQLRALSTEDVTARRAFLYSL